MSPAVKLVFLVLVTTFMLQSGLAAPRASLAGAARRAREIASGLILMLVLGPLIAVLVGRVFGLEGPASAALLVLAVVGVVPLAPKGARKARGDVPLSIVLMLALSLVTAFSAAPSARLALSYWSWSELVGIEPASFLLKLLLLQTVPLAIGLFLRNRSHRAASLEKVVGAINMGVFAIVALFIILPRLGSLKELGLRGAAAGMTFAVILAALGWALGGPAAGGRRTLAAVVNMPNIGLALPLVANAYAPPAYTIALLAMFVVRLVTGLAVQTVLARRTSAPPAAGEPGPRYGAAAP
jgi:predicted Na+-dependent transporter